MGPTTTADTTVAPEQTSPVTTTEVIAGRPSATNPTGSTSIAESAGDGAQVIAQGVVEFPAGPFAWDHDVLGPENWPYQFTDAPPAFYAAAGPDAVLMSGPAAPVALLDTGEAVFLPTGSSGSAAPTVDGAVATARRITFVAASDGATFTPGAGHRDVNLIGGVVAPGDALSLPSSFPALVIVVDGTIIGPDGHVLESASVTTLDRVELHNDGDVGARVIVAVIGSPVP